MDFLWNHVYVMEFLMCIAQTLGVQNTVIGNIFENSPNNPTMFQSALSNTAQEQTRTYISFITLQNF